MLQKASPILAAAASPAFLAKGCVNVIEFENLKDHAGSAWPRLCEGIYSRLEGLLRSKLGPYDIFVRLGETAYMITMPTSEPEDVSAVCARVAFDLQTSLLGRCDLHDVVVAIASSDDDDTLLLKRLPFERVMVLAEKGGIPREVVARAAGLGGADASALMAPIQSHAVKNVSTLPLVDEPPPVPRVEYHFMPVWSVPNAAVTGYACEPKTILVSGRPGVVPMSHLTVEEKIEVEVAALNSGAAELAKAFETPERFLLVVPLSFDVLGTPAGRMEILASCRYLPSTLRAYLTFMIYDVPLGVAQSRLATMITVLRPFTRGVMATVAPGTRAFGAYEGIGLRGIGFNLRESSLRQPVRQLEIEQMAQFARRTSLSTFLWDVRNKETLRFAQDAGIQNISGPAVCRPSAEPQGMLRLSWAQVLAKPETELWV